MHNKLRPGEPATVKSGQQLLYSRFFDPKRYDLGYVGRHKINQRLNLDIEEDIGADELKKDVFNELRMEELENNKDSKDE